MVHAREVLVELYLRGLQTSSLFKILTLRFVLFYIENQIVFQTYITEIDTLEKKLFVLQM